MAGSTAIDLSFLSDVLQHTIGVLVDEQSAEVLLIGPEGDAVSVRFDGEDFDIQYQEFGV
jgi:hypothetical protein